MEILNFEIQASKIASMLLYERQMPQQWARVTVRMNIRTFNVHIQYLSPLERNFRRILRIAQVRRNREDVEDIWMFVQGMAAAPHRHLGGGISFGTVVV